MVKITELAEEIGVSVPAIRSWVATGKIPFYRSGGRGMLLFDAKEVRTVLSMPSRIARGFDGTTGDRSTHVTQNAYGEALGPATGVLVKEGSGT